MRTTQASVHFWWEPDGMDVYLYLDSSDGLASRGYGDMGEFLADHTHPLWLFAVVTSAWPPDLVGEYPLGSDGLHLSFGMTWAYDHADGSHKIAFTDESLVGTYAAAMCLSRVWPDRLSGTVTFTSLDGWPLTPVDIYVEFDVMGGSRLFLEQPGSWALGYDYNHIDPVDVWDPAYWHAPVGGASP